MLQQTNDMTIVEIDPTDSYTVFELDCKIHVLVCAIRQNYMRGIDDRELRFRFFQLTKKWQAATGLTWGALSNENYFERSAIVNHYMSQGELRPWLASHVRGEMVGELLHGNFRDQTSWLRVASEVMS